MTRDDERLDIGDAPAEHPASIPSELPVLPLRDTVLFPHAVLPLTVGRESSVQLINSLGEDKTIVVIAQREARIHGVAPVRRSESSTGSDIMGGRGGTGAAAGAPSRGGTSPAGGGDDDEHGRSAAARVRSGDGHDA